MCQPTLRMQSLAAGGVRLGGGGEKSPHPRGWRRDGAELRRHLDAGVDQPLHRLDGLHEHGLLGRIEVDLDDALAPPAPITTGTPT